MNFTHAYSKSANIGLAGHEHGIFGRAAVEVLAQRAETRSNIGADIDSSSTDIVRLAATLCMTSDGRAPIEFVRVPSDIMLDLADAVRSSVLPTLPQDFTPLAEHIAETLEVAAVCSNSGDAAVSSKQRDDAVRYFNRYGKFPGDSPTV